MGEMFDINLLSQVQGLDKKFSISKEQPRLKIKVTDDNKHKGRHYNDRRTMKNTDNYINNDDNFSGEDKDNHAGIDITV
ncbi:MAG: hypothetical protein NT178_13245 [Proteobacteria bacterium]|nr:hypothetical protein [Pseudomonadota bacterium]